MFVKCGDYVFLGCPRNIVSPFERIVEGFGAKHKPIPPKAWSYNSDVETVHRTMEDEFYGLENFDNIRDFHRYVASSQAWYNLVRGNMNKDDMSPWWIIKELYAVMNLAHRGLMIMTLCWEIVIQEVLQVVAFQNLFFGRSRHSIFQNVRDLLKQTCEIDRLGYIVFNTKSRSCCYIMHPAECCYHYYRSVS